MIITNKETAESYSMFSACASPSRNEGTTLTLHTKEDAYPAMEVEKGWGVNNSGISGHIINRAWTCSIHDVRNSCAVAK